MSCLETRLHTELQCMPGLTDHSDLTGKCCSQYLHICAMKFPIEHMGGEQKTMCDYVIRDHINRKIQ